MSILKTQESLQRMFNQSKKQQEKKRLRKTQKQQSLQRLKEIYHHQDILLKKSLQERKKTTMDNLSKLIKKRAQEPQKPPQNEFYVYNERYRERYTDEDDLYDSIEELQAWENENYPCINWDAWHKVVQETKKQIEMLTNE